MKATKEQNVQVKLYLRLHSEAKIGKIVDTSGVVLATVSREKLKITWKKKVYDPPGYTGAIWQEEVDGDPLTMPGVQEWYAYANGREVNVIHQHDRWIVRRGKESSPMGFMKVILFQTEKERVVRSAHDAVRQTERWLSE